MAKYLIILFIALVALLMPAPALADTDEGIIGTILEVEGTANVTPAGGDEPVAAAVNMPVHLNDVVQTGADSRAFILFIDDTKITLSENTQVRVDKYIFDPDDNTNNKSAYAILQGGFRYISGLIGKKDNPDVHVETPVGSIGIRGTDFWAGNLDDQYGVAVNEGQVALKTDAGEEVVNKGQGTSVKDRKSIPAHAAPWSREQFQRLSSSIRMRHPKNLGRRIMAMRGRQVALRQRYKSYMTQHYAEGQNNAMRHEVNKSKPQQRHERRKSRKHRRQGKRHTQERKRQ